MKTFIITETYHQSYHLKARSLEDAMLHADEKRASQESVLSIHDRNLNLIAHRILDCLWLTRLSDGTWQIEDASA